MFLHLRPRSHSLRSACHLRRASTQPSFKSELLSRFDSYVPSIPHPKPNIDSLPFVHNGVTVSRVTSMPEAKEFMLKEFYPHAPITRVLRLDRDCPKTRAFVDREMSMYLQSGLCLDFRDGDNTLVGVGFTAYWPRDPNYKILETSGLKWHNTAAEIAKELPDASSRHLVWRKYQFQCVYNLAQALIEKYDKPAVFYAGGLTFAPSVRRLGLSEITLQRTKSDNAISLVQSNFRGFDKYLEKADSSGVEMVDEFAYGDEMLELDGEKVFKEIEGLGSVRFYAYGLE